VLFSAFSRVDKNLYFDVFLLFIEIIASKNKYYFDDILQKVDDFLLYLKRNSVRMF